MRRIWSERLAKVVTLIIAPLLVVGLRFEVLAWGSSPDGRRTDPGTTTGTTPVAANIATAPPGPAEFLKPPRRTRPATVQRWTCRHHGILEGRSTP